MNDNFNMDTSGVKAGKWIIKILVFIVYSAGAIFATLAFTNEIANFFPNNPLMNFFAHVGAWANCFSVLLMIWAKDYWVTGKSMMTVAVIGWGIEVVIMALNTLASFGSQWADFWTGLSPATPVFVIALWGLLWLLHPDHKARQQKMQFYATIEHDWQDMLMRSIRSQAVQDTMKQGAQQAAQQYTERSLGVVIDPTHGKTKGTTTGKSADAGQAVASNNNGSGSYLNLDVPVTPDPTQQQRNGTK